MTFNLISKLKGRLKEEVAYGRQVMVERGLLPSTDSFGHLVVLSTIRTDSTMLGSRLASHPQVEMMQEIFHRDHQSISSQLPGYQRRSKSQKLVRRRQEEPSQFLEEFVFSRKAAGIAWVGFHLMYIQARIDDPFWNGPAYADWFDGSGVPPKYGNKDDSVRGWLEERADSVSVIHLIRENVFDQYLSREIVRETGAWGEGATGRFRTDKDVAVMLDPTRSIQHIEATQYLIEEGRAWCDESGFKTLQTTYDAIAFGDGMDEVFDFLGLFEDRNVPTRTRRQSTRPWYERSQMPKKSDAH